MAKKKKYQINDKTRRDVVFAFCDAISRDNGRHWWTIIDQTARVALKTSNLGIVGEILNDAGVLGFNKQVIYLVGGLGVDVETFKREFIR